MPNLNLHVPEAEVPLWDAARRVAKKRNTSLYRIVAEALKTDLPRIDAQPMPAEEWADIAKDAA